MKEKALSSLQMQTDIIIKPVDKGLTTVVSKDNYMYLTRVMHDLNMKEQKVLEKETYGFLQPQNVRTYYQKHKPGIPGRLIVLLCGPAQKRYCTLWTTILTHW